MQRLMPMVTLANSDSVNVDSVATIATESTRWFGRASVANINGVMVLTYIENPAHPDNGDEVVHIKFSDDYGATWSTEDTYLDSTPISGFPNYPTGAGTSDAEGPGETLLIPCPNGDLLLITSKVDYNVTIHGTWMNRSTDGGQTWGGWSQIDFTGITSDDQVEMPNDWTIIGSTIYTGLIILETGASWASTKVALAKSTDNGATWAWVSDITDFATNTLEVGIEYIGNDTIIAMIRDTAHTTGYKRVSTDAGATWGTLTDITSTLGILGKPRVYTRAHLKGEANWWNDNVLIMSGFNHQVSGSSTERRNAVWISRDAGGTWSLPKYIDISAEDGGYGDIFYNPTTGKFIVVNYFGTQAAADLKQYNIRISGT